MLDLHNLDLRDHGQCFVHVMQKLWGMNLAKNMTALTRGIFKKDKSKYSKLVAFWHFFNGEMFDQILFEKAKILSVIKLVLGFLLFLIILQSSWHCTESIQLVLNVVMPGFDTKKKSSLLNYSSCPSRVTVYTCMHNLTLNGNYCQFIVIHVILSIVIPFWIYVLYTTQWSNKIPRFMYL